MRRLLPLRAGLILVAACHVRGVPFPQHVLRCVERAAADRGYQPAYSGDRPKTLLLSRRSGHETDNLFVTATIDSMAVSHVQVIPSTMHFADASDPTDRELPTSSNVLSAAAYVRQSCEGEATPPGGRPNKRLKLAGGDRFKGSGVLCPGGRGLSSNVLAPAGESPAA